jgi:rSAM/selenodomain-associated transferase 2
MNRAMVPPISIIVPVLNEAGTIRPFLEHIRNQSPDVEIIVVDGGSSDGTSDLAANFADQTLTTSSGRALQMNAGAAKSRGDILWFLHADVRLPPASVDAIEEIMADPEVVAGFFRIRLPESQFVYRLTDSFAHYLGLILRMRCGDHGIFCRRTTFLEVGGFPEVPLMEDAELFRILHRRGKVRWSKSRIIVSPRRYHAIGPFRLTFFYGLIGALYGLGFPLGRLAAVYSRYCQPRIR